MNSYFTEQEYTELLIGDIDTATPLAISHVSKTQFSIGAFSGGCIINGRTYYYSYQTDELKAVQKMRRDAKKEAAKKAESLPLF